MCDDIIGCHFLFGYGTQNLFDWKSIFHKPNNNFDTFTLQQIHHIDSTVIINLVAASIGISGLFLYCYFGRLATESFEKMAECLYCDLIWQKLPIKFQKYLIVMIVNMQKSIYYHGFGYIHLELRTFINVRFIFIFQLENGTDQPRNEQYWCSIIWFYNT